VRTSERRELIHWAIVSVLVNEGVLRIESLNAGDEILIGYNGKDEDRPGSLKSKSKSRRRLVVVEVRWLCSKSLSLVQPLVNTDIDDFSAARRSKNGLPVTG
jgi:hypothetical protein